MVWAPNLLLPMEGHEPMVALSSGCEAEVFNIHTIKENFKEAEELSRDDIMKGVIRIEKGHTEVSVYLLTGVYLKCFFKTW